MSIHFASDPESVPGDLSERELAWLRAIGREDYLRAAKLARAPLPTGASRKERRKWYMRKFQMRGIGVEGEPARVQDQAAGAPELELETAGALRA